MPRSVKVMPSVVVARRTFEMSWLVLPLNGAAWHCWSVGIAVAPVLSPLRIFCTYITVMGDPAAAVGDVGKTAMMPSGLSSPTVAWTETVFGPPSTPVFCSAVLIDLMSLLPGLVLLVFAIGNLGDELSSWMT